MSYIDKLFCEKFADTFRDHVGKCPTCLEKLAVISNMIDDIPLINILANNITGGKSLSVVMKEIINEKGENQNGNVGETE